MGHHMSYVKTINTALAALRGNPDTNHLAKMGLDKLLKNLDKVPEDLQAPVRNGGGCASENERKRERREGERRECSVRARRPEIA